MSGVDIDEIFGVSPKAESPKVGQSKTEKSVVCYLCGNQVEISKAKTSTTGGLVHEECLSKPQDKPQEVPSKPTIRTEHLEQKGEFDNPPPEKQYGEVYMIYGLKGHGKTGLAESFPGQVSVLSFDRKSDIVKKNMFNNDPRITVYDAIRWLDWTGSDKVVESSDKTFRYVQHLLESIQDSKSGADWIVIDSSEEFQRICENTMRYRNNLNAIQGVTWTLWKERKMFIRQIHNRALETAKKGIIYTTYTEKDEVIKDGQIITKEDVPRWIDVIMLETDVVIRVTNEVSKGERRFYASIESSKTDLPTGLKIDVTNRGYEALEERMKGSSKK